MLCGFFLLLAFHFLLRYLETGERRYNLFQWAAFLLGFGALELNVVYPAIAAAYTLLCVRRAPIGSRGRPGSGTSSARTLPMFAVSIAYALAHNAAAPAQKTGDYAMHFTGAMFRTLGKYWTWSVGPTFLFTPFICPSGCCPPESPWSPPDCLAFSRGSCAPARASPCSASRGIWPCWLRCCPCATTRPNTTSSCR